MATHKYKPLPSITEDGAKRFWHKVDKREATECWPWIGGLVQRYGAFVISGKWYYAHRVAYLLSTGENPDQWRIRHSCDNPTCCNPTHLLRGTQLDNIHDMDARGRRYVRRGAEVNTAKLTPQEVLEIRKIYKRGQRGAASHILGRRYGVDAHTIIAIVNQRSWRHL